jgi:hypothetical protein
VFHFFLVLFFALFSFFPPLLPRVLSMCLRNSFVSRKTMISTSITKLDSTKTCCCVCTLFIHLDTYKLNFPVMPTNKVITCLWQDKIHLHFVKFTVDFFFLLREGKGEFRFLLSFCKKANLLQMFWKSKSFEKNSPVSNTSGYFDEKILMPVVRVWKGQKGIGDEKLYMPNLPSNANTKMQC